MDFKSRSSQKKYLNNNSNTFCDKNHYLKNVDNEFFIVTASDFFEIYRHHKELVQKRCNIVFPRDVMCNMHFKLERMQQFVEHVRDKKLNFHKVVKKLAFFIMKTLPRPKKCTGGQTLSSGSGQMSSPTRLCGGDRRFYKKQFFLWSLPKMLIDNKTSNNSLSTMSQLYQLLYVYPLVFRYNYKRYKHYKKKHSRIIKMYLGL